MKILKDFFIYLKMKGVKEVYTSNVVQTLKKNGVLLSNNDLINILQDVTFVSDISGEKISINGKSLEVDTAPDTTDKEDASKKGKDEKFDMDKFKVQQMAKRSLFKKD